MNRKTSEQERRSRDAGLDETLAGTFPASDPLSTLPDPDDDAAGNDDEHGRPEGNGAESRLDPRRWVIRPGGR